VTQDALDHLAIRRFSRRDYSSLARGAPADGTLDVFRIPGRAP
jgi:hypothetical protein